MSAAPEQIVQCLDQLELVSDNPMALKLLAELKLRLADFVNEISDDFEAMRDAGNLLAEERDDLLRQLEAICREPV